MALINYNSKEINAKIVYYGPALSGKTTNIKSIFEKINPEKKGKLITLPTQGDRTLFFDFFPLEAGEIRGYKMRFHLYTVPGQVYYNATRKLVLKGADGVVFVADSQRESMDANLESIANLRKNLAEQGINLDDFPFVIQYNKKDLPDIHSPDVLNRELNHRNVPFFTASASNGEGVLETLTAVSKFVLADLKEMIETGKPRKRMPPVPVQEAPIPRPSISPLAEIERTIDKVEKGEDLRSWVQDDSRLKGLFQRSGETPYGGQEEKLDLSKPVPEASKFADTIMEGIFNVALNLKLRVITAKEGDKIKVKGIEVSDFEPKEIDVTKK
ncbi:MAG: hypothetical protein HZA08_11025 [Nitrospirae bacterium]|nr:hypothetical protein [Nitrospirota bacterium]